MMSENISDHPHLRVGSLLIFDDIQWKSAFFDFACPCNTTAGHASGSIGLIVKA